MEGFRERERESGGVKSEGRRKEGRLDIYLEWGKGKRGFPAL